MYTQTLYNDRKFNVDTAIYLICLSDKFCENDGTPHVKKLSVTGEYKLIKFNASTRKQRYANRKIYKLVITIVLHN